MNEISTTTPKTFFTVKDKSNYKVLMTYDREEVIEFEQYKKLMTVLNSAEVLFLTINQRVVNKTTIIDISPTNEKTVGQRAEIEKREQEAKKIQDRKDELARLKSVFDKDYFNEKYGEDNWRSYPPLRGLFGTRDGLHILTAEDKQEVWKAFVKQYPAEAKEIDSINDL